MTIFITANNAGTTLAGSISSTATTAALAPGTGSLFPSPTTGQQFALTFVDALTGLVDEIVYVQSISGDTITAMTRGQEGTTPRGWLAGDLASNFWTSGQITALQNLALFSPSVVSSTRNLIIDIPTASASATVTADEIVVETALGGQTYKLASFSKSINISTVGAGGMDVSGLPATSVVAIYAIFNPATGASALLGFSAPAVKPTEVYSGTAMPAGYTASALVGLMLVTSSLFQVCYCQDRHVTLNQTNQVATSSSSASLVATSMGVPFGSKNADINVTFTCTTATNANIAIGGVSTGGLGTTSFQVASGQSGWMQLRKFALRTPNTIWYSISSTSGTPTTGIALVGYDF